MVKKTAAPLSQLNYWEIFFGLLTCLLVFFVPFFPDEKLVRLKLQALEFGIFALVGLTGLRILWDSEALPVLRGIWGNRPLFLIYLAAITWFGVQIILWFFSSEKFLASGEMRRLSLAFGSFFAFSLFSLSPRWKKSFFIWWATAAGLLAAYGLLQVKGGFGPVAVPQMERPMGTYGNPIFFAAFLLPSVFVTRGAVSVVNKSGEKFGLISLLVLQILALYFSETRAAWIAFGAAFVIGIVWKLGLKKIPMWVWPVLIMATGIFVFKTKNVWMRDQAHILIWRDTLKMWENHPVMGVGPGAFHTNFVQYAGEDLKKKWPQGEFIVNYAHNEYFQMLAEVGILGFIPFILILIFFFRFELARSHLASENFYFVLAATSLLFQNFFSVDMRFSISFAMFFILLGVSVAPDQVVLREKGVYESQKGIPTVYKLVGSALWIFFLGGLIFPQVKKPYLAQKEVSEQKDFFDVRVLDPAKTVSDLEKLALQYPNEPAVIERLAFVYAKEMKTSKGSLNREMVDKAISTYQRLIQMDPNRLGAYNNLANIYYTLGNPNEAIGYWNKAVGTNPQFLEGHLNLGKVLYVQGRLKESAGHFEKALKIDPKNSDAIVYLRKMVE